MTLSIVIPCYDEEASVGPLFRSLREETATIDEGVEFVFVDDGSTDATLAELGALAELDERVRYISFSRNFGKEAAMLAGLRHAEGDAVVIMDADLQHPPELIHRLHALHRQGFDQVVAQRDRNGERAARTVAATAFYWLVNRWVDVQLTNGAGDFRLLSRRAVDAVLDMPERNRFSKGLFSWMGFETAIIEYRNSGRASGRSKWTLRKLGNYAMDGAISFNNKPLRLAIYSGAALSLVAVLYMFWIIFQAAVNGVDSPGYVTIITAIVGFGGIQMTILGIIGEYVGRIYYETKQRPHYLVKATSFAPGGRAEPAAAPVRGTGDRIG
ncbi:glycosyltransferase family 2 protein [Spirillospora sp. NPDC047279]|uniref:glycosyltransferase family 2 protein n=1 Tax=Spirillospora sp. NPDC047279 TaxID=3155478 RepID=UPI0033C58494